MAHPDGPITLEKLRSLGGQARARNLSAERRKEIARLAAQARWKKNADAPDPNGPKGPKRDGQKPGSGILSTRKPCRQTGVASNQPTLFEIPEAA